MEQPERDDEQGLPVWAIVGPTASGKSGAAMRLAACAPTLEVTGGRPVEVVAVDAFTIYRGIDVVSAKPSEADRADVAHHLVDVLDPWQDVSVAQFQRWARAAIAEIHGRGHVPLLVGGSGLYFRAVVDDLDFPPTDPAVRLELEERWGDDARGAHTALGQVDPTAAALVEPDNLRRSIRALEVVALTGRRFSSFRTSFDSYESLYDLHVDYLEPPAEVLRARIHQRTAVMVDGGLLDEVAALQRRGLSATAAQAIGVAETRAVLDGHASIDDLARVIGTRTWRYARRQRSWFRRDPRCQASRHASEDLVVGSHLDDPAMWQTGPDPVPVGVTVVTENPRADEREMLTRSLDLQRAILAWKCAGLDRVGMATTVGPSALTLAGLLKHMTMVEEWWFTVVFAGGAHSEQFADVDWDADEDWDFTSALDDDPEDLRTAFDRACAESRALLESVETFDQLAARPSPQRGELSLRWIMVHMIEEYARHNGHADLLREAADGATGSLPPSHPLHEA